MTNRQGTSNHKCLECGHEFTEFNNDVYSLSFTNCPKCGSGENWLYVTEKTITVFHKKYRPKLSFFERLGRCVKGIISKFKGVVK